ncbi:undecaprenyl-diphosphate phosphatase [Streptomyces mirabilis]
MLFITEQLWRGGTGRRRAGASTVAGEEQWTPDELSDQRITGMTMRQAMAIGVAQILALLPGTSRSGSTIGAGIFRGLNREDSARFAFLLSTPVIGGAALLKPPPLLGSQGNDLRGPHGFANSMTVQAWSWPAEFAVLVRVKPCDMRGWRRGGPVSRPEHGGSTCRRSTPTGAGSTTGCGCGPSTAPGSVFVSR